MILKVTALIWSTNAALSSLFGKPWRGAVKKRPQIREFRCAGVRPSAPAVPKYRAVNLAKWRYLPKK
jgi:hypothetical protein